MLGSVVPLMRMMRQLARDCWKESRGILKRVGWFGRGVGELRRSLPLRETEKGAAMGGSVSVMESRQSG